MRTPCDASAALTVAFVAGTNSLATKRRVGFTARKFAPATKKKEVRCSNISGCPYIKTFLQCYRVARFAKTPRVVAAIRDTETTDVTSRSFSRDQMGSFEKRR